MILVTASRQRASLPAETSPPRATSARSAPARPKRLASFRVHESVLQELAAKAKRLTNGQARCTVAGLVDAALARMAAISDDDARQDYARHLLGWPFCAPGPTRAFLKPLNPQKEPTVTEPVQFEIRPISEVPAALRNHGRTSKWHPLVDVVQSGDAVRVALSDSDEAQSARSSVSSVARSRGFRVITRYDGEYLWVAPKPNDETERQADHATG
ncbi:MAG: hypothetical protein ABIF82_12185 [Planctomycetota bacterium]